MGRGEEARLWLETVGSRTEGYWPDILVFGGTVLRESGEKEMGEALIRFGEELAEEIPALPGWAPAGALFLFQGGAAKSP